MPLQFLHYMEVDLQTFRDELLVWNRDLTERAKTLDDQIAQLDRLIGVGTGLAVFRVDVAAEDCWASAMFPLKS